MPGTIYDFPHSIELPKDLRWTTDAERTHSLQVIHKAVTDRAHQFNAYYDDQIPKMSKKAWLLRTIQLGLSILVGIGLLAASVVIPLHPHLYFIGVAAGALLVVAVAMTPMDGLCGYSGCWMRSMRARESIAALLDRFEIEWQEHQCKEQPDKLTMGEAADCIKLAIKFDKDLNSVIALETRGWIAEFSRTLNNMEKKLASYEAKVERVLSQ